jgi:hypothetical protein
MGFIKFLREGTWWVRSESDPRWNASGRAKVGMYGKPDAVDIKVAEMVALLGDPPDDLEWGYMKD